MWKDGVNVVDDAPCCWSSFLKGRSYPVSGYIRLQDKE